MDGFKIIFATGAALITLCAMVLTTFASAGNDKQADSSAYGRGYDNRMSDTLAVRMVDAHNRERTRLGLPRLKWNRSLEREAKHWGHELAKRGRLEHADQGTRNNTGENLWMGSQGHWDVMTGITMMMMRKGIIAMAIFRIFLQREIGRMSPITPRSSGETPKKSDAPWSTITVGMCWSADTGQGAMCGVRRPTENGNQPAGERYFSFP